MKPATAPPLTAHGSPFTPHEWRSLSFTAVNTLVNRLGWRWVTRAAEPRLRSPQGGLWEFKLVRRQGALVRKIKTTNENNSYLSQGGF